MASFVKVANEGDVAPGTVKCRSGFSLGCTQEVVADFSIGLQYNLERRMHHDRHSRSSPPGATALRANPTTFFGPLAENVYARIRYST